MCVCVWLEKNTDSLVPSLELLALYIASDNCGVLIYVRIQYRKRIIHIFSQKHAKYRRKSLNLTIIC